MEGLSSNNQTTNTSTLQIIYTEMKLNNKHYDTNNSGTTWNA